MNWFAHIVVRYPYVILIAVGVLATACIIVPLTTNSLPNFSDPQLGFEARGTELAKRLTAWKNLIDASRPPGALTSNPHEHSISIKAKTPPNVPIIISEEYDSSNRTHAVEANSLKQEEEWEELNNEQFDGHQEHYYHQHLSDDGFFCENPNNPYARVVFTTVDGSDLFDIDGIRSMCHIENYLTSLPEFVNLCQTVSHDVCCPAWSLGNYIALLNNKTSCSDITSGDVDSTKQLLTTCAKYFHNLKLSPKCPGSGLEICNQVPTECESQNAIYNILYYLADIGFLPPSDSKIRYHKLTSAATILPVAQSVGSLDYYYSFDSSKLQHGKVKIVAMEFGLKNTLFNACLIKDTWMIGAAGFFVLISMWMYTGSFFITFMTVLAIVFSLAISYVIYTFIFNMRFFPFMNLFATVVAVGIGADDAFIFCKVWQCTKAEKNNVTVLNLAATTLRHAVLSMLVSSLTTAAAFYASYISSVTAISCFSVFAGTATLANFILMVTWLPATVIIAERWCFPPIKLLQWFAMDNKVRSARAAAEHACTTMDNFLSFMVIKFRYFSLLSFGSIAIGSVFVIFYFPRLKLPDSKDFQLFETHHVFEQYDLIYKHKFWSERLHHKFVSTDKAVDTKLPLRFVWGILPLDNGNYLDPSSRGNLQYDNTFDVADPASQKWLLKFCRQLRRQPFYESYYGPMLPHCFMESFTGWMKRECIDRVNNLDRTPCCDMNNSPPYRREIFEQCIVLGIASLYQTPIEFFVPGIAGPKFCKDTHPPKICAVIVEFDSNHTYSLSYKQMNRFYNMVEKWTQKQMSEAPPGMRNGWFISELEFYDLQSTLSSDTLKAIGISMTIALSVLILVTQNILISLYAIATITCIIFVTIGTLVLIGWKLNVLESIAMSLSIGLAVDFSLHYGVHYQMCPNSEDRRAAVSYAISRMGGPTAMAALTTAAAGAFMLPSSILAYIQTGIFLIVIMGISWFYSTFFLGALLSVFGPQNGFCEFSYSVLRKCCSRNGETISNTGTHGVNHVDKAICTNVLSESTLSTSSTVCALRPGTPESHELEALTSRKHGSKRLKRSGSASAAQQSSSNRLIRKVSLPAEQSPSATSATTIVMIDDYDFDSRLGINNTEQPLLR